MAGKTYDRRRYMSPSLSVLFDVDDSLPFDTVLLSVRCWRGLVTRLVLVTNDYRKVRYDDQRCNRQKPQLLAASDAPSPLQNAGPFRMCWFRPNDAACLGYFSGSNATPISTLQFVSYFGHNDCGRSVESRQGFSREDFEHKRTKSRCSSAAAGTPAA